MELEPCPFCGSKATFASVGEWYSVGCINVQCRGDWFISKTYEDTEKAAEAWNARAERTCHALPGFTDDHTVCSACGYFLPPFGDMSSYCPNCGAKVVEHD